MVIINKKEFENSSDFMDFIENKMEYFLFYMESYDIYTTKAEGDSLFEYEEGISFYYTDKGQSLVDRWISRMSKIFYHYFPEETEFNPRCCYYKTY